MCLFSCGYKKGSGSRVMGFIGFDKWCTSLKYIQLRFEHFNGRIIQQCHHQNSSITRYHPSTDSFCVSILQVWLIEVCWFGLAAAHRLTLASFQPPQGLLGKCAPTKSVTPFLLLLALPHFSSADAVFFSWRFLPLGSTSDSLSFLFSPVICPLPLPISPSSFLNSSILLCCCCTWVFVYVCDRNWAMFEASQQCGAAVGYRTPPVCSSMFSLSLSLHLRNQQYLPVGSRGNIMRCASSEWCIPSCEDA